MQDPVVYKKRSGATRQAEYAARMRAAGYKQRTLWLTAEESRQVDKVLDTVKHGDSHE